MKQMKKKKCHSYWTYFRRNLWKIGAAFGITSIATGGNFISTHILSVFVDKIANEQKWEEDYIKSVNDVNATYKIELKKGQYLSDIKDRFFA